MAAAKEDLKSLEDILNKNTSAMADVTSKKMFGCHAVWVKDKVFALVWKHGRIGVKLPTEKSYETLMSVKGAEPWKAGPMKMAHWVLVPETFHSKKGADFKKWVKKAYEECSVLKTEPKKKGKSKK
ncbi:TfoX/Sxy family protein [bacterium]|jgi:TfoX/Sxy family transcriptional regulator of competence genes|nr:TfoX/Sxy family protein [bacterium]